ncbi:hypothetical protein LEP1GSC188_0649 [Leptospira weilii serovar Topaz str. LT2116]|uniref:Uncharacterized protein n=1 Tax=Leptospira weilii serovar Topaz str. LT2116 TaxID=1088540 RepID=M3G970_9LEPT|nr:hypothetical protein LEP1GSC188_0649 [Leptospira weilii serovar Topaz str. LT2116]
MEYFYFPQKNSIKYVLPLKADVRKKEKSQSIKKFVFQLRFNFDFLCKNY